MSAENAFAMGQRWLSNAESDLGLGTVVSLEGRTVTLLFPATGESRVYAKNGAPLTRIQFEVGDTISSHDGWQMEVAQADNVDGLMVYSGKRKDNGEVHSLIETRLDHHFQLDDPLARLTSGQIDDPKWFDLRAQCIQFQHQHATSPLLGFVGARLDIIPHQLHIAREVGKRYSPRVLLADEVGLGKTIEAALIIHQQLLTHRAKRVLIVVPSSLVHQWLVEMLRRVNLHFAIFDEERCQAMEGEQANPFEAEQLVLCSLDFLTHNSRYYAQACEAEWDLLVVDEAHHLGWAEGQESQEYQVVEQLATRTKGVLLLTATPDQLGHESHFARLRLLDPARFHDYQSFVKEEQRYAQLAEAISPLLEGDPLSADDRQKIAEFADETMVSQLDTADEATRQQLIAQLLDRHGTGRVLFRNRRASIAGFPSRKLHAYPLALPDDYQRLLNEQELSLDVRLNPERHSGFVDTWTDIDPRVDWLIEQLQTLKGKKVLAICSRAATALQLAEALRVKSGIRATVFHEGMSIVERDKAANYFAQSEAGAQILICSEIGSEGRNFQFAHHLVLLDLPRNPDLLEQRIGRLDRIGQTETVNIHVPVFINSAQALLKDWYHLGLNSFEQTCPVGAQVFDHTREELEAALQNPSDTQLRQALIERTATLNADFRDKLEQGRDRLLELNSSGQGRIEGFLQDIADAEQSPTLERFMTRLFDGIGVLQEEKDDYCYLLRPTESMPTQLPGLSEEGMTVTYERETAAMREDTHFLSWDHPMIHHAMDMVVTETQGKSAIGMQFDKQIPAGAFWIECLFVLSGRAMQELQLSRYLPPTPMRICLDGSANLSDKTFLSLKSVSPKMANQLTAALAKPLAAAVSKAQTLATDEGERLREQSRTRMQFLIEGERDRLIALQKHNPAIRDEEIAFLSAQQQGLSEAIDSAQVHLEAIRLVVNNH